MAADGTETRLHAFTGQPDGASPAEFVLDAHGNLYGTTAGGGSAGCYGYGCGTVFKLTP
jgi:uncharacterized repeat protein (TIGR03803 family)